MSYLQSLRTASKVSDLVNYADFAYDSMNSEPNELAYYYAFEQVSYGLIQPLIRMIRDYDPRFKSQHQDLLEKLPDVLNKDNAAIQRFKETLARMVESVDTIRSNGVSVRNNLAKTRDDLAETIRKNKNKLSELEPRKSALNGRKEVLEREIREIKKKIDLYTGLSFLFGWLVGILVLTLKPFDAELNNVLAEIKEIESSIRQVNQEKTNAQKSLVDSNTLFDTNQSLISGCDALHNHAENVSDALGKVNIDGYFLKAKLSALQREWSDLVEITDKL